MQVPPRRQPEGSSWPPAPISFEAKIEDEERIVDAMLASLARGRLPADAWDELHVATRRDGRVDEVASAFMKVSWGPRLTKLQPSVAAEFLFQAARFLDEVLCDDLGAAMYLERSLTLAPAHANSFAKMEAILDKRQRRDRLAELYAAAAPYQARGQQALMLRRAAELLAHFGQDHIDQPPVDDRVIDLWLHIVQLEPGDDEARSRLEALYLKAGRFSDAVRLNEQSLDRHPAPDAHFEQLLLERMVDLYANKLDEPERAIAHVERLLSLNPSHEGARLVGQKLLLVKGLAGRAAAALSSAFGTHGTPEQVAHYLSIELESAHGPSRTHLMARLGNVKEEQMGDYPGALEAYDQALLLDPTDLELRGRYVDVAVKLGRQVDAAKMLERVIATVNDPAVKASASVELGETLLGQGDAKRAKAVLSEVLGSWYATAAVELRAARALRTIYETTYDRRALCDVLDRIASLETDAEKRREANERLAAVATKLRDTPRAIEAYERLLSTRVRAAALDALAKLYRWSGQWEKYARVLEDKANDADDAGIARGMMMRAAELRAKEMNDAPAAIATCQAIIQRFGPERGVLALLLPLLETEGRWIDLARALEQDAALAPGAERAAVFARLGLVRLERLGDAGAAIQAFTQALAVDDREATARAMLEQLVAAGDQERLRDA
jgi:tetratricopeptide (TPR) repeat protein